MQDFPCSAIMEVNATEGASCPYGDAVIGMFNEAA